MSIAPQLTTPSALAARWQVSATLIYDMLNRGDLPGFRLGKLWRIKMSDIEAYEDTQPLEPIPMPEITCVGNSSPPAAGRNQSFDVQTHIRLSRLRV